MRRPRAKGLIVYKVLASRKDAEYMREDGHCWESG